MAGLPLVPCIPFLGALLAVAAGCGEVRFVDTPFAPRKITAAYSIQEDVTVIRWHLGAEKPSDDVRFELLGADRVWRPVDFSTSVFAGGVAPCADGKGVCAQLVLPGRYDPPQAQTILRAFHPDYGVSPGDAAHMTTVTKTLTIEARFLRGNGTLATTVGDVIGGDPVYHFPRPLERSVWERLSVCVTGFHPADAVFAATGGDGMQRWPGPVTLSQEGRYCAGVRALTTTGAAGVDESIAVDTLPEVTSGNHTYTAPTEITPFSYKIVLDLSIPVADRCQEAMRLVEDTVRDVLQTYSPTRKLPTIDLAEQTDGETPPMPCHQYLLRKIDGVAVAQEVKRDAAGWPEKHQRFQLLYFNNLRALIAPQLGSSIDEFAAAISSPPPPTDFLAQIWGYAPPETLASYPGWGHYTEWLSASDDQFRDQLVEYAKMSLPLISEIHDSAAPIPILDAAAAASLAGGLIRLCEISVAPADGGVSPVRHDAAGNLEVLPPRTHEWPVVAADPPAYLLNLPPVVTVPNVAFTPHQARIRYEVCTRYCSHGFVAESGAPVAGGWAGSALCMGPEKAQ